MLVRNVAESEVALLPFCVELALDDTDIGKSACDLHRPIGRIAIEHDDVVAEFQSLETRLDVDLFVLG
jgi:hypothetical protein